MAKTDTLVSVAGTFQETAVLLDAAVRKRGGTLSEAIILLGKPEHSADVDSVADILARICNVQKAALEVAERVRVVNKTTIMVNLASAPKLPTDGFSIEKNFGGGWVKVERKKDSLYIDGRKVALHLEEGQKTGVVRGHTLRDALTGKPVLHPNIMDALFDHQHLIPESWKQDEQGRTRYIFFWGVIYRGPDDDLCVRYLYWDEGAWGRDYGWLHGGFDGQRPAAVSAS